MRIVLNLNSFGVTWNSWGTETAAGHWLLHSSTASSSSSSSYHHYHHQAGRWFEVGKEASPKKRLEKVTMRKEKRKNMRKKRVSKKNFHRDEENEEEEDDDDEQEEKGNNNISNSFNGGGGGGSVMEGSRCSRVNGRGWRCCQQTLVGYALCEHHLGKGRLRSMLNVRSRSSSNTVDNNISNDYSGEDCRLLPRSCRMWEDGDQGGEEEKIMMMKEKKKKKKRKRIGMVKARSISSLLCQTHQAASSLQQQQRYTSNSNDVLP